MNLNEGRFCIPPNLHFSTLSFYMLARLWKCDNGVIINVFHLTAKIVLQGKISPVLSW